LLQYTAKNLLPTVAELLNKTSSEIPDPSEVQQEGVGERERVFAVEDALIDRLPKVRARVQLQAANGQGAGQLSRPSTVRAHV
jgi:hypothetical protein